MDDPEASSTFSDIHHSSWSKYYNPGVKLLKICIGNKDKGNRKKGKDSVDVSLHQIVWRPIVGCDKPRQIAAQ